MGERSEAQGGRLRGRKGASSRGSQSACRTRPPRPTSACTPGLVRREKCRPRRGLSPRAAALEETPEQHPREEEKRQSPGRAGRGRRVAGVARCQHARDTSQAGTRRAVKGLGTGTGEASVPGPCVGGGATVCYVATDKRERPRMTAGGAWSRVRGGRVGAPEADLWAEAGEERRAARDPLEQRPGRCTLQRRRREGAARSPRSAVTRPGEGRADGARKPPGTAACTTRCAARQRRTLPATAGLPGPDPDPRLDRHPPSPAQTPVPRPPRRRSHAHVPDPAITEPEAPRNQIVADAHRFGEVPMQSETPPELWGGRCEHPTTRGLRVPLTFL